MAKASIGLVVRLFRFGWGCFADAGAFAHVDDLAVFGEPVNEGSGHVVVFQKARPLFETKLCRDHCCGAFMAIFHESKKESGLIGIDVDIAHLVNE